MKTDTDRSWPRPSRGFLLTFIVLAALAFMMVGCTDDQVRKAEFYAAQAKASYAQAEKAYEAAKILADATNNEQAKNAVAKAGEALAIAKTAVETADTGVQAAKTAQEAGGSTISVIFAAIMAAAPPLIANVLQAMAIKKRDMAIRLTAKHADRMEEAETEVDVKEAKDKASNEQLAAGVQTLIAKLR